MRELKHALVLGGAGFLGRWIVSALQDRQVCTTVVDDLSRGSDEPVSAAELIVADVRDLDLVGIMKERRIDVVFHLATPAYVPPSLKWPADDLDRNVGSTLKVLESIRALDPAPLIVYASSAAVYGEARHLPMSEDHPIRPVSPYGVSKFSAEQYLRLYADIYDTPSLPVRLFSLYGPGQRKQVVYDLIRRAASGDDPLTMLGAPHVSRDLVFVGDAARIIVTLASRATARGEAYNIASGRQTTLRELAETIRDSMGLDIGLKFSGQVRPGDPLHWWGDPSKARALGAECQTTLREGVEQTIAWFARTHAPTGARV